MPEGTPLSSPIAAPVISKLIRRTSTHLLGSYLSVLRQYCRAVGRRKYFRGNPRWISLNGSGAEQLSPAEGPSQFSKLWLKKSFGLFKHAMSCFFLFFFFSVLLKTSVIFSLLPPPSPIHARAAFFPLDLLVWNRLGDDSLKVVVILGCRVQMHCNKDFSFMHKC